MPTNNSLLVIVSTVVRKLKLLNPDYRFMIRRSEDVLPDADLVLIAY